ncbi:Uu.00g098780.m01.CDS01 [Anthostomella pinea]|uniref:Uu.00g098780.m01.CDS01 n=1 Tax=Anthostomella pinea TaxID=933095 RepID=A0AAI8YCR8_9PEZI|nr:Uu.00g098780.m01.CDS01 [Anthostomella pinea]
MTTTARANLGPLTAPFTYPASCTVAVQACSTCGTFWQAQTCSDNAANTQGVQDNAACWPPRDNAAIATEVAFGGWGFYSPGLSCPVGFATACSATANVAGGTSFQFPLEAGETGVGCCPTGYSCSYKEAEGRGQTCYSVAAGSSFAAASCSSGKTIDSRYYDLPATVTFTDTAGDSSVTAISTVIVFAPLFQLVHQGAADMTQTSSQSSSATQSAVLTFSSSTGGSSASSSTSSTASSQPSSSSASIATTGLSTGAKAGIGIGVGIGALILLAAAAALIVRRRKRKGAAHESEIMTSEPKHPHPLYPQLVPQHVHQTPAVELETPATATEIGSSYHQVPELPS